MANAGIPYFLAPQQPIAPITAMYLYNNVGDVLHIKKIFKVHRYTPTTPNETYELTKHETVESLLSAVFPYAWSVQYPNEPDVGAGPLAISEPTR